MTNRIYDITADMDALRARRPEVIVTHDILPLVDLSNGYWRIDVVTHVMVDGVEITQGVVSTIYDDIQ